MEIKEEIIKIVDTLPEEFLKDLRDYLVQLHDNQIDKSRLSINLNSILLEDHNLLKRLAQ
jgi:hypothetical protein